MESNSRPTPARAQDSASPTTLVGHENSQCMSKDVQGALQKPQKAEHVFPHIPMVKTGNKKNQLFQPLKSPKKSASSIFYTSHVLHISQILINGTVWTVSVPADRVLCQANIRKTIKHIPATLLLLQRIVQAPAQ